ncbi:MAG TPA: HAMP domain-containing sensor histidine kinase [Thermoanaerobaculia bacterium]|nr:HAMP domain-containing sensor histidine kinase [Thermoanaerobaculia bacterium]
MSRRAIEVSSSADRQGHRLATLLSRRPAVSFTLLALLLGGMLVITREAIEVISAVRAYVGGEGLWSKAQKDAVYQLAQYAATGKIEYYQRYLRDIAVPLADRRAREELEKPRPDPQVVAQGFIGGRNHPQDVDRMARLFRHFRRVSFMAQAISIWQSADLEIARLQAVAERLHAALESRPPVPLRVAALLAEIDAVNTRLTGLENGFSRTLGAAARFIGRAVFWTLLGAGAVTFLLATAVQEWLLQSLRSAERNARESEAVKALHESLRHSQTMAALGELVAGVAHAVRNPLFGLSATLDALALDGSSEIVCKKYIAVLKKDVERLSRMMKALLEYAKPRALHRALESVDSVLGEAVGSLLPLAERRQVCLLKRDAAALPALSIDRQPIVELLQCLLENAIYHSPPGTVVEVAAQEVERAGWPWIEISVWDKGEGFDAADLQHVFEPFFGRRSGGAGLGLAIAQRLAGSHGGRVSVGNRTEGGAWAVVELPIDLVA